nr:hypothetical protein CFP56_36388 [Quercus suber]
MSLKGLVAVQIFQVPLSGLIKTSARRSDWDQCVESARKENMKSRMIMVVAPFVMGQQGRTRMLMNPTVPPSVINVHISSRRIH